MTFVFLNSLSRHGLTNIESEDLGTIASGTNRDKKSTYCSGSCFKGSNSVKGVLVHVGEVYLKTCPKCGEDSLFHEMMSFYKYQKLKEAGKIPSTERDSIYG